MNEGATMTDLSELTIDEFFAERQSAEEAWVAAADAAAEKAPSGMNEAEWRAWVARHIPRDIRDRWSAVENERLRRDSVALQHQVDSTNEVAEGWRAWRHALAAANVDPPL